MNNLSIKITGDHNSISQQRYSISPAAASYMRPEAGLNVCIYIYSYKIKQVRFHRNIAASSLAADCHVPQQPLLKVEILHLFRWRTHTHPAAAGPVR